MNAEGAASLRWLMRRTMLATALVAAALLAGCGKTNTALIPGDRASALQDTVNQVQDACNNHDVQAAQSALDEASAQINELPRKVDRQLKANLRDWVNQIERRVDRDCQDQATPTSTPTQTETPSPTADGNRDADGRSGGGGGDVQMTCAALSRGDPRHPTTQRRRPGVDRHRSRPGTRTRPAAARRTVTRRRHRRRARRRRRRARRQHDRRRPWRRTAPWPRRCGACHGRDRAAGCRSS